MYGTRFKYDANTYHIESHPYKEIFCYCNQCFDMPNLIDTAEWHQHPINVGHKRKLLPAGKTFDSSNLRIAAALQLLLMPVGAFRPGKHVDVKYQKALDNYTMAVDKLTWAEIGGIKSVTPVMYVLNKHDYTPHNTPDEIELAAFIQFLKCNNIRVRGVRIEDWLKKTGRGQYLYPMAHLMAQYHNSQGVRISCVPYFKNDLDYIGIIEQDCLNSDLGIIVPRIGYVRDSLLTFMSRNTGGNTISTLVCAYALHKTEVEEKLVNINHYSPFGGLHQLKQLPTDSRNAVAVLIGEAMEASDREQFAIDRSEGNKDGCLAYFNVPWSRVREQAFRHCLRWWCQRDGGRQLEFKINGVKVHNSEMFSSRFTKALKKGTKKNLKKTKCDVSFVMFTEHPNATISAYCGEPVEGMKEEGTKSTGFYNKSRFGDLSYVPG